MPSLTPGTGQVPPHSGVDRRGPESSTGSYPTYVYPHSDGTQLGVVEVSRSR